MRSIKSMSLDVLIILTGCLIACPTALSEESTELRETQSSPVVSEAKIEPGENKKAKNKADKKKSKIAKNKADNFAICSTSKNAVEENLIRKTEPLPQFYFPY